MLSFISSHPGPFLMLGVVLSVYAIGAVLLFLSRRLFPPGTRVRAKIDGWVGSIKQDPARFGKRLQRIAFGLLILAFVTITVVYS